MNNNEYLKFKKKIKLEALIKMLIITLSLVLFTFSIPFLIMKIKDIEFKIIYLILISFSVGVISFLLTYFLFRVDDKKVAKRLDKEFNLHEKVETMIEYNNKNEMMVNLQREHTLSILANISIKKLSLKIGILFIILLIISISCCVTAIAYPSPETIDPGQHVEPPKVWETDDWTEKALYDLIQEVKATEFDEGLKGKYVNELELLLSELNTIKTEDNLITRIENIVKYIDLERDKINTNNEIFTVLSSSTNSKVNELGRQIYFLNSEKVQLAVDTFIILIAGKAEAIVELDPQFRKLLTDSNLDKNDELYKLLLDFSQALYDAQNASEINEEVKKITLKYKDSIVNNIVGQKQNKDIADYIIDQLIMIFGLEDHFKENEIGSSGEGEGGLEDNTVLPQLPENGSGGIGDGEYEVASDDVLFDLEEGVVKYGAVIDKYYAEIGSLLERNEVSEETKAYFKLYYDLLFGDFSNEETNNQQEQE